MISHRHSFSRAGPEWEEPGLEPLEGTPDSMSEKLERLVMSMSRTFIVGRAGGWWRIVAVQSGGINYNRLGVPVIIANFVAAAQTKSSRPVSIATQTGASSIKLIATRSLSTCTLSTTWRISFQLSRPSIEKAAAPVLWIASINEWSRSITKLRNRKPRGTLLHSHERK